MEQVVPYLGPAVAAAALLYAIISNRSKANNDRVASVEEALKCKADADGVEKLDARLDAVEDKVITVEQKLESLPDKDAIHRLELSVARLNGNVEVLGERITPIGATCQRLQEALERKV